MEYLEYVVASVIAGIFSGITWMVRRLLTNEKQIELLHSEIKDRDVRRQEDREIMYEIKTDLKEVKRDVIELYKAQPEDK